MNYDAIFFDVGNTLFFYNYDFLRDLLAERFNVNTTNAELETAHKSALLSIVRDGITLKGHDVLSRETYKRWFTSVGVDEDRIDSAIDAIRSHPFRHLFWARLEDGTREMLDWFRERGFKLGVISNAEGQIKRLLEHTNMDYRFDVVLDSGVEGISKPDRRIFNKAAETIGTEPSRCIFVGDLYDVDVLGAQNAGMTPILVDRTGKYKNADCLTVARVADLTKLPIFSGIA